MGRRKEGEGRKGVSRGGSGEIGLRFGFDSLNAPCNAGSTRYFHWKRKALKSYVLHTVGCWMRQTGSNKGHDR